MGDSERRYEFRCPVHGFVQLNQWERDIVNHPAFQRLRRIRQLGWTDYLYPGATHTRFEHSLGVLYVASLLFAGIVDRSMEVLKSELSYGDSGLKRHEQLVRLAALLHDIGHGPFSHAGEELMPERANGGDRHEHEDYSAAIIRSELRDVIEHHPSNEANWEIKADDVAAIIEGSSKAKQAIFWRDLITGQMDADRMDYLLRDSLHAGVQYGRFDLNRIASTIVAIPHGDRAPRLGVTEGGFHPAESLVLARYFMFTQVYFHRTRIAYDYHLREALKVLLPNGEFPRPINEDGSVDSKAVAEYLSWDDWRVLGLLHAGQGGEHGERLTKREHYRDVYHTPESPDQAALQVYDRVKRELGNLVANEETTSGKSWYKTGDKDIPVVSETETRRVDPLSHHSSIVANMKPIAQKHLYVRPEDREEAARILNEVLGGTHGQDQN